MIDGKLFRIYPDKNQQTLLLQWIGHQRFIYNAKVAEDRYFRTFKRKSPALVGEPIPVDQQYSHFITEQTQFLKEVPSQILRNGAYKWITAQQRFVKKVAKGRPTFQNKYGRQSVMITMELFIFSSLTPQTAVISLGTKKHPVGAIKINTHKTSIPYEVPNMVAISIYAGKWYLSFNHETEAPIFSEAELLSALQHLDETQLAEITTGFDRNVVIPVAGSNGVNFDYSLQQKKNAAKALKGKKKWQQRHVRRQKSSANQRKATKKIARYDGAIANIRKDFCHQTSHKIVASPGNLLVFEALNIKNMTASARGTVDKPGKNVNQKAGLNRSILNSGWGKVIEFTRYKALRRGKLVIEVRANYSSQDKPCCCCS